jgi:hypothetical protein
MFLHCGYRVDAHLKSPSASTLVLFVNSVFHNKLHAWQPQVLQSVTIKFST